MKLTKAQAQGPTRDLLTSTIGAHLDRVAARDPDHPALVMPHQNIRWSYGELVTQVNRLATGLLSLGIKPGDRVGIWSPNRFEWVLTQFATARIGAVMVCVNPAYRLYELEYALNKVSCKAIIAAESFKTSYYVKMLQELAPELNECKPGQLKSTKLPHLTTVIAMGDTHTPGMFNFDDVCSMGTDDHYAQMEQIQRDLDPSSPINIQFTSGTTGNPKGATLTH